MDRSDCDRVICDRQEPLIARSSDHQITRSSNSLTHYGLAGEWSLVWNCRAPPGLRFAFADVAGCSRPNGCPRTSSSSSRPRKRRRSRNFSARTSRVLASYGHVRDLPRKGLGVDRDNAYEPTYEVVARKGEDARRTEEGGPAAPTACSSPPTRTAKGGDLLAPAGGPEARRRRTRLPARALQRDHQEGRPRRRWTDAGEIDGRPRGRAAGAPHHGPARRLRGLGPPLEEDLARALGRARPDGRAADHLRARDGDRGLPSRSSTGRMDAQLEAPRCRPSPRGSSPSTGRSSSSTARTRGWPTARRPNASARTSPARPGRSTRVETAERRKNPPPPFITSQLQQAAARRLCFAVRRTMQIAQRLYEGARSPGAAPSG